MRYLLREQDRPPLLHSAALQKALLLAEERAAQSQRQQQQSKGYYAGRSQQQQQSAAAVATTATPSISGSKSILLSKCRRPISKARGNNQESTSSLNKNNINVEDDREDDDDDDDDVFDISQDDDDDDWEDDDDDDDYDDEIQEAVLECDFYRNPTILSRLILHQKYTSAIRRVQEHPNEARVWLCTIKESSTVPKRELQQRQEKQQQQQDRQQKERLPEIPNDDDDGDDDDDNDDGVDDVVDVGERDYFYAMRQLPIHMCCQNLFRAVDAHLRGELEELIGYLAYAYPAGCTYEDHCGNLPLHAAVWHHCKPEAISILLMAAPRVSHRRDHCYGKTAIELNQNRTTATTTGIVRRGGGGVSGDDDDNDNREQVQYLLTRGSVFWEMARQEAHLRLKHRVVQRIHNADDYTALASVGSTSVLASSQAAHDNSTILTHDDITDLGGVALGGGSSIAGGGGLDGENNGGLDSENADLTSIPLDATETERESSENNNDEGGPSGVVHPLAWSQLEQRALNLEEALAEVFQQNYQMAETISELEQQHVILEQQLQEQQKRQQQRLEGTEASQVKDVQRNNDNHLQEENAALRLQLKELTLQNSQYKRRLDLMEDHLGALSDNASSTTGDGGGKNAPSGNKQHAPSAAQDEATADNNNNETTTSNSLTLSSMDHAVCGSSASRSTATATTIDDDDVVVDHHRGYVDADAIMNSILYDAEKLNGGQQLSSELLSAWKAVSVSCRSMSTTLRTDDVGVIMPVMYDTINENADAAPLNKKATAEEMMEVEVVEAGEGAASPTSTTSPTTPAYSPAATTTKGGASSSSPASAVTPTAATSSSRLVGEMLIEEADANAAALEQGRMLRQQYEDPASTTPPRQNTNLPQPTPPTTDRSVSRSASSSSQPVARSVSRNASSSSQPGHRGVSRNVSSSSAARRSPYPVDPLSSREESSFEGTGGAGGAVASGGIILFRNNDDQGSLALSSVTSGERVVLDSDDLDAMFAQAAQMSDNLDVMFAHAAGAGHNGNSSSSAADDDAATPSENPSGIWV